MSWHTFCNVIYSSRTKTARKVKNGSSVVQYVLDADISFTAERFIMSVSGQFSEDRSNMPSLPLGRESWHRGVGELAYIIRMIHKELIRLLLW